MKHDLYKCVLQFYRSLGIDILFDSMDSPGALSGVSSKIKEVSSCNNISASCNHQYNNSKISNNSYKVKNNDINKHNNIDNEELSINNTISNSTDIINYRNVDRSTYNKEFVSNNVGTGKCNDINHINNSTLNNANVMNNSLHNIIKQYDNNPPLKQLLIDIDNIDCIIKHTARNTVVFDGNINSEVMIIGEAPGQEEDIQGKPFVGQSGMLLNNMLRSIGLSRENVIISNIVFWRPPFNRTPSTDKISLCLPYVQRLIEIIMPKVLLLLGAVSNHALLNTMAPMSRLRGSVNNVSGIKAVSTYHPAYLLRSSTQKKYAFHDFLLLKHIIDGGI
ncbi:MAG: hypothetical protein IJU54_02165 [Alphaproteobacteria bacterium]|nr:hypothetical protein [Alphaproteobacteria bacterium]